LIAMIYNGTDKRKSNENSKKSQEEASSDSSKKFNQKSPLLLSDYVDRVDHSPRGMDLFSNLIVVNPN
jgi:hypothetical protein